VAPDKWLGSTAVEHVNFFPLIFKKFKYITVNQIYWSISYLLSF
jgi:hypothetical protein